MDINIEIPKVADLKNPHFHHISATQHVHHKTSTTLRCASIIKRP